MKKTVNITIKALQQKNQSHPSEMDDSKDKFEKALLDALSKVPKKVQTL